jgi:hypothetical protein
LGDLLDAARDTKPVHFAEAQRLKDQKVKSALK